ncbi:MAG: hypothetical protein FWC13_12390 [Oscillospiraceae bacterium]|nr:hypothetical protein [Oscillospiraceae bacterium]
MTKFNRNIVVILLLFLSIAAFIACSPDTYDEEVAEPEPTVEASDDTSEQGEGDDVGETGVISPAFSTDATSISVYELSQKLRADFQDRQRVIFYEPHFGVPRDSTFTFELEFEISLEDAERYFGVYIDSNLTERLPAFIHIHTHDDHPDELPEGHSWVHVLPPWFSTPGSVSGMMFADPESLDLQMLPGSGMFHLREKEDDWGFFSHYYIVQRIDLETGVPFEMPWAVLFTLENPLSAPTSEFFVTPEGLAGFHWDPIEGADFYVIVRFDAYFNEGVTAHTTFDPVAMVTEPFWVHPESYYGFQHNSMFDQRWWRFNYTVIAVNSETHSAIGNIHNGMEIGARIPMVWDFHYHDFETMGLEEGFAFFSTHIGLLPSHLPIRMANGEVVFSRIIYDFDSAELTQLAFGFSGITSLQNVFIPFTVEGTPFYAIMVVDAPNDTYQEELDTMRDKLENLAARGGGKTYVSLSQSVIDMILEQIEMPDTSALIYFREDDLIYANSALSAFLAHNMLAVNEVVDLSMFPESADTEYLVDAFFEAIYQNPLIMHVDGISTVPGSNIALIHYRKPAETILTQQDALRRIIPEIVSRIITENMTDFEKSLAINHFLVETAVYDWAALENAELHNFASVDPRYFYSFTAYGILINQVGVCSGYAAAYHLLAHAAGLRSIVVTGYLEGFLPHAWNRVYINGHWHTVDVTNNANEFMPNAFLHLSDSMARGMLVEDSNFVLDNFLMFYRSNSNSDEYFIVSDRFFPIYDIAEELVTAIATSGSAVLRTDYNLTHVQFSNLVMEVMARLGVTEILAAHMLGVISLSL